MTNRKITDQEQALLEYCALESTSLAQALTMAADGNDDLAKRLEDDIAANGDKPGFPGPTSAVARLMRESAAGWRAKAARLTELVEALPEEAS